HTHRDTHTHTHTHTQKRGHARTADSKCRATDESRRERERGVEGEIVDIRVTGVQTCALPISHTHRDTHTHTHTHTQKRGHARTAASKCRATAPRRRAVPAGSCCSHLSRLRTGPFDETTRSAAAEAAAV